MWSILADKADDGKPVGKKKPLDMWAVPWKDIAIDLVSTLQCTEGYSLIWVVTDKFLKTVHLIALGEYINASRLASRVFWEVVYLYGLLWL